MFETFSLQNEKLTDELRVYDGENETGEMLGVFYGGHPPPKEGIYSSSSRMFLIFKSDKTDSYTGFSASYSVGNKTDKSYWIPQLFLLYSANLKIRTSEFLFVVWCHMTKHDSTVNP